HQRPDAVAHELGLDGPRARLSCRRLLAGVLGRARRDARLDASLYARSGALSSRRSLASILKMKARLVYSTGVGRVCPGCGWPERDCKCSTRAAVDSPVPRGK